MKTYLNKVFNTTERVHYFDELPLWSAPFGLKLLAAIAYKRGITALDIGFGTGFPLVELAMRLDEQSIVYGIDPWKEAIDRASRKAEYYQISNIRIIEGVAESIPLADTTVDLIVSNNGINNVNDLDRVLSECARIAKPGAQFVLSMNLNKSMFEFYDQLEQVLKQLGLENEIALMYEHIYQWRRPLAEMKERLEQHGFEIKHIAEDEFQYRFTDATTMFNHGFIGLAFLPSWKSFLPSERHEEIFDLVESRWNTRAQAEGGLTLSIPFVVMDVRRK